MDNISSSSSEESEDREKIVEQMSKIVEQMSP